MIAGYATLSELKKSNSVYSKINKLGDKARKQLSKVFDGKVIVSGKGSLFMTHFLNKGINKIENAADASKCNSKLIHKYHFEMMVKDGIFFLPGKLGAFSNAHSNSDVKNMIESSTSFSEKI